MGGLLLAYYEAPDNGSDIGQKLRRVYRLRPGLDHLEGQII